MRPPGIVIRGGGDLGALEPYGCLTLRLSVPGRNRKGEMHGTTPTPRKARPFTRRETDDRSRRVASAGRQHAARCRARSPDPKGAAARSRSTHDRLVDLTWIAVTDLMPDAKLESGRISTPSRRSRGKGSERARLCRPRDLPRAGSPSAGDGKASRTRWMVRPPQLTASPFWRLRNHAAQLRICGVVLRTIPE